MLFTEESSNVYVCLLLEVTLLSVEKKLHEQIQTHRSKGGNVV